MKALLLTILAAAAIASCSPFSPDLGVAPYKCGPADPGPRCPSGYACMEGDPNDPNTHVCVAEGETAPDGGNTGFQCLDDTFGMNDAITGAFQTPVAGSPSFAALTSICPAGDKDNYGLMISTPATVRISTTWESGMPVSVSLLGASGNSIGNGIAVPGTNAQCLCQNNLPTGTYFAEVFAGAQTQNNYRVEIKIATTADCVAPPTCTCGNGTCDAAGGETTTTCPFDCH